MRERAFVQNVKRCGSFLEQAKLLRVFTNNTSLTPSDPFKEVATDPTSAYLHIYLTGIRLGEYNILLEDYSYFQFSILNSSTGELRYAYYPNPYFSVGEMELIRDLDEDLERGILTFEEYSQLLSESKPTFNVPLIRYEVDYSAYNHLKHPTAHFHVGLHMGNRWPVERILTPFMFCLFISKLYYINEWNEFGDHRITKGDIHNRFDKKMIEEKNRCIILPDAFFSDIERQHPYIG